MGCHSTGYFRTVTSTKHFSDSRRSSRQSSRKQNSEIRQVERNTLVLPCGNRDGRTMEHTCSSLWQSRREDHGTHLFFPVAFETEGPWNTLVLPCDNRDGRTMERTSEGTYSRNRKKIDHRHVRPDGNAISFPAYFHNHSERQCGGFSEHFPHRKIVLGIHLMDIFIVLIVYLLDEDNTDQ